MSKPRNAVSIDELTPWLRCVECGQGKLRPSPGDLKCQACNARFPSRFGVPVLLRRDNELFPQSNYIPLAGATAPVPQAPRANRRSSHIFNRSINLCRDRNLRRIAESQDASCVTRILVIGSGSQALEVLDYFDPVRTKFVFCDIAIDGDLDFFCDAHELPFSDDCFDGLITTAVMEHVLYPEQVAAEISRVVRAGGWVYSEIPFLQSVHMGAYDFTRFTLGGHRRLYQAFTEIDAGMVAGAGTVLIWSLQGFARSMFRNRRLAKGTAMVIRLTLFWLKYFDVWFQHNPNAADFASATYFYGTRTSARTSAKEILQRYSPEG